MFGYIAIEVGIYTSEIYPYFLQNAVIVVKNIMMQQYFMVILQKNAFVMTTVKQQYILMSWTIKT